MIEARAIRSRQARRGEALDAIGARRSHSRRSDRRGARERRRSRRTARPTCSQRWDRQADAASRGAVLFFAWADKFLEKPAFAQTWSADRARATPDGLGRSSRGGGDARRGGRRGREASSARSTCRSATFYRLRWRNGVDLPANGASGKYGIFRVTEYQPDPDGKQRAFQGDSFVALVEFANPVRASALLSYGNAERSDVTA